MRNNHMENISEAPVKLFLKKDTVPQSFNQTQEM